MISAQVVTPPALEPLSIEQLVAHLRLPAEMYAPTPNAEGDAELAALIAAARVHVEDYTRRSLISTQFIERRPGFPTGDAELRLTRAPLIAVDSIAYTDPTGAEQTLAAEAYSVSTAWIYGLVRPAYGTSWPSTRAQWDAVRITYRSGYGTAAASVPAPILAAMKLLIGHWWLNREAVIVGTSAQTVPMAVESLLAAYRIPEAA